MYGHPVEAKAPLSTVTLDVEGALGWVSTDLAKPALYLLKKVDGVPSSEWAEIRPTDVSYSGSVATFTFDPIWAGNYRVVVRSTRMRLADSDENPQLVDANGFPWSGWDLTVLGESRTLPELPEQDIPDVQLPENITPMDALDEPELRVLLDGKALPAGSSELSGEVLTVESTDLVDIEIRVESLLPGAPDTLYERFLMEHHDETSEGVYRTHFVSAGPIGDWAWARYHDGSTEGKLPQENGQLLVKTPVIRAPLATDPLITFSEETVQPSGHPNSYKVVRYSVVPHYEKTDLASYTTKKLIFPLTLDDEDNTPDTNPRLFAPEESIYDPKSVPLTAEDAAAAYDLPLFARIYIYADGRQVWWGQTRMVGLAITLRRLKYFLESAQTITSPADAADLRLKIWRASLEAIQLWGCSLPKTIPSTMEEFVLTRLAMGWSRENDVQGKVAVRMGDHFYSGTSDHQLPRRLAALAALLEKCETTAPLFPEDELPATTAYLASDVVPSLYPAGRGDLTQIMAPLYGPTRSLRDYYDPPQHGRPPGTGGDILRR